VLIIGTGLTMIDAAITLGGQPGGPEVRAISRSGLIPKPHRPGHTTVSELGLPPTGPISINDAMGIFLAEECRSRTAAGSSRTSSGCGKCTASAWPPKSRGATRSWSSKGVSTFRPAGLRSWRRPKVVPAHHLPPAVA